MTAKAKKGDEGSAPPDQELWRRVTSGVKPLKGRKAETPAPKARPAEKTEKPEKPRRPAAAPKTATLPWLRRPPTEPPLPSAGERRPVPGLDKRTTERLRRGEIPIDARLDLHGLTQTEAASALIRFVRQSRLSGFRCLLIITGKGGKRRDETGSGIMGEETGILKQLVPRWLGAGAERAHILAIAPARAQHGGAGALYVLLRRAERG